jgi:hypothetical protein
MAVGSVRGVFASLTGVDLPLMLYPLLAKCMEIVSVLKTHADSLLANKEPMVGGARAIRSVSSSFIASCCLSIERSLFLIVYGTGDLG